MILLFTKRTLERNQSVISAFYVSKCIILFQKCHGKVELQLKMTHTEECEIFNCSPRAKPATENKKITGKKDGYLRFQDMVRCLYVENQLSFRNSLFRNCVTWKWNENPKRKEKKCRLVPVQKWFLFLNSKLFIVQYTLRDCVSFLIVFKSICIFDYI